MMMQKSLRGGSVALGVAIALALAGCTTSSIGGAGPSPSSAGSPTGSSSPAPSSAEPTPIADASESPGEATDPATWEVSPDGIGPILVGMDWGEARAAMPSGAKEAGCSTALTWSAPDAGYDLLLLGKKGAVTLVAIASTDKKAAKPGGPRTGAGIGLGTGINDVLAAYPDAVQISNAKLGDHRQLQFLGGKRSVFFTYTEGQSRVWQISATSLAAPPYKLCR